VLYYDYDDDLLLVLVVELLLVHLFGTTLARAVSLLLDNSDRV
jgi:hypothetical protein